MKLKEFGELTKKEKIKFAYKFAKQDTENARINKVFELALKGRVSEYLEDEGLLEETYEFHKRN